MRNSLKVLLGLLLLAYVKAQECVIEPADRVDCQKGDETTCVNSGCCWDPTWNGGPAWCFHPGQIAPARDVMVHLFEWKWKDIAQECEDFLGPMGFDGVQVSPPQEHRIVNSGSNPRPWWERYQPVSYKLVSRSGNEAEFIDMVNRCNNAGVNIYVDAVINHMTGALGQGQQETGTAGSTFGYYSYPEYSWNDFHHYPDNSNQANCGINSQDYQNDAWRVRNCDLSGLTDLDLSDSYVRGNIGKYFQRLVSLGVKGFRIDAAKHAEPSDLEAIYQYANGTYIYQEVIDLGGEAIEQEEYQHLGALSEFNYGVKITEVFRYGKLSSLSNFGESWGLHKSDNSVAFICNHDNERGHGAGGDILNYQDGYLYSLASIFMLAHPYGYTQVLSSYVMSNTEHGPPSQNIWENGRNTCFDSGSQWVCQHRWQAIANMAAFRKATRGEAVANWWTNGANQIAFSRGNKGFIAMNKESSTLSQRLQTSLPSGAYCNVIKSTSTSCEQVTVDSSGYLTFTVNSNDALAIHVNSRPNNSSSSNLIKF